MSAIVIHPVEITESVFTRASTATYLNAAGVLVTAAVDERRPLFVGGVQTGWIYEPAAATNQLLHSRADSTTGWAKGENLTRVGSSTAPDGTGTATTYQVAAAGNAYVCQVLARAAATTYTISVWARLVSGSAPTTGALIVVDHDTNGTAGTLERSYLPFAGLGINSSWQRFSLTFINVAAVASSTTYVCTDFNIGVQIAIWGAQIEIGSSMSSYIPTAAAAATRAAEALTSTGRDLVLTNAVETVPEWVQATSYTVGTKVLRKAVGRIFMNLVAGVDATRPESAPTRWEDIGPTNAMAMFDKEVGSVTTATDGITVVLQPGAVSGMALQELRNATGVHVEMSATPGGPIEFERFISLESVEINSFYDWYFAPVEYRSDAQLVGLPRLATCEMRVTIFGNGAVGCGLLAMGKVMELGQAQYGASIGIINKSVKTENKFGRVSVKKLGYARRMNYTVWTEQRDFNRIIKFLADTKDDPCIFIVTDVSGYESLSAYGFYKDFNIEISYPTVNLCSLQIEGLV